MKSITCGTFFNIDVHVYKCIVRHLASVLWTFSNFPLWWYPFSDFWFFLTTLDSSNFILIHLYILFKLHSLKLYLKLIHKYIHVYINKAQNACIIFVFRLLSTYREIRICLCCQQCHVTHFWQYVKGQLFANGTCHSLLCDRMSCKDPLGCR